MQRPKIQIFVPKSYEKTPLSHEKRAVSYCFALISYSLGAKSYSFTLISYCLGAKQYEITKISYENGLKLVSFAREGSKKSRKHWVLRARPLDARKKSKKFDPQLTSSLPVCRLWHFAALSKTIWRGLFRSRRLSRSRTPSCLRRSSRNSKLETVPREYLSLDPSLVSRPCDAGKLRLACDSKLSYAKHLVEQKYRQRIAELHV
jgi:hypothetical protein